MPKEPTNQEVVAITDNMKSVGDLVGSTPWYPEVDKLDLTDALGEQWIIEDARILEDFETKFGEHPLAQFLVKNPDTGAQFTVISSGMVIVKKTRKLLDQELIPCLGTFTKPAEYYDLN